VKTGVQGLFVFENTGAWVPPGMRDTLNFRLFMRPTLCMVSFQREENPLFGKEGQGRFGRNAKSLEVFNKESEGAYG
jgi:hypothetical protein